MDGGWGPVVVVVIVVVIVVIVVVVLLFIFYPHCFLFDRLFGNSLMTIHSEERKNFLNGLLSASY